MKRVFERALDENGNLTNEEFRNLAHESFDGIFAYLEKQDFYRWIDAQDYSARMKELLIEEFSEQEKQEHPRWNGFYTRGTNRIKLLSKTNDVNTHESYHFLTDGRANFPTFIDEGLTEYMNMGTNNKTHGSYSENVGLVKFLHFTLGDTLIKNYLMGKTDEFDKYLSTFLSSDGKENLSDVSKFYRDLGVIHDTLHSQTPGDTTSSSYLESVASIRKYVAIIAANYIKKQAHNLEYYLDGMVDVDTFIQDLSSTIEIGSGALINGDDQANIEFQNSVVPNAIKSLVEESHILVDNLARKEVLENILSKSYRAGYNTETEAEPVAIKKGTLKDNLQQRDDDAYLKLAKKRILEDKENVFGYDMQGNNGSFDVVKLLSEIELISQKMGATDYQKQAMVEQYLFKLLPDNVSISAVRDSLTEVMPILGRLYQDKQEYQKHVRESGYSKLPDGTYLEKVDNKYIILDLNLKAGEVSRKRVFPNEVPEESIGDIDDLMRQVYTDQIVKQINKSIQNRKYSSIINDAENPYFMKGLAYSADVDMRSRKMDVKALMSDLTAIMPLIPLKQRAEFTANAVIDLAKRTYGSKSISDEAKEKLAYLATEILADKNSTRIEEDYSAIEELEKGFNSKRREIVEENKKHAAYVVPPEKRVVFKVIMEGRKEQELLDKRAYMQRRAGDYVESYEVAKSSDGEDTSDKPFDLIKRALSKTMYLVGPFKIARMNNVDFDKMKDTVSDFIQGIPEDKREKFLHDILRANLSQLYGDEHNLAPFEQDERREIYDSMEGIFTQSILHGEELKKDELTEYQGRLHAIIQEQYKIAEHYSAIGFSDKESRVAFSATSKIATNSNVDEPVKRQMIADVLRACISKENPNYATMESVIAIDEQERRMQDNQIAADER